MRPISSRPVQLALATFLGLFLFGVPSWAEINYRVVRSVRLLTNPTAAGQRIKTLHPPEPVTATGGKRGDYVRVRDESDDVGWVYLPSLTEVVGEAEQVGPDSTLTGEGSTSPGLSPTVVGLSNAVLSSWEKPTPEANTFRLHGRACGPTGQGAEAETNRRKNRIDIPNAYHAVTFDAVDKLPYPDAPTTRSTWSADELAQIAPFEGVALTVTGYLVALKPQAGSSEACNCGWSGVDETDWHMALVGKFGQKEEDALVVETTPRIRVTHPNWTTSNLSPWQGSHDPIRVSGWLLMDPQHKGHLKGHIRAYRNTLWEIHPILRIEVMKNGAWVDLDDMPLAHLLEPEGGGPGRRLADAGMTLGSSRVLVASGATGR